MYGFVTANQQNSPDQKAISPPIQYSNRTRSRLHVRNVLLNRAEYSVCRHALSTCWGTPLGDPLTSLSITICTYVTIASVKQNPQTPEKRTSHRPNEESPLPFWAVCASRDHRRLSRIKESPNPSPSFHQRRIISHIPNPFSACIIDQDPRDTPPTAHLRGLPEDARRAHGPMPMIDDLTSALAPPLTLTTHSPNRGPTTTATKGDLQSVPRTTNRLREGSGSRASWPKNLGPGNVPSRMEPTHRTAWVLQQRNKSMYAGHSLVHESR
jgi:hypothetical protein